MSNLTPKEARELWATELESGQWRQGTGQLARDTAEGTEYCCLGVACELAVRHGIIRSFQGDLVSVEPPYEAVREWLGLADGEGRYYGHDHSLTADNDEGQEFAEIARTIRAEPEGLVVA